jgi:Na+/proline symporter
MAMKDYLPVGLKGLILAGFLAAYMSTISTQLNFGASVLTNDFFLLISKKKFSDKQQVTYARIITLLLVVVSLWVTTIINSISGVWKFIIECGAGLGLVLILRWYWWRINAWSEIAATVTPFVVYGVTKFILKIDFPQSFFITVGITTVMWVVVTYLTKPTDEQVLKDFYVKVRPAGAWNKIAREAGIKKSTLSPWLFVAWFSAILMGYGILFFIGKLLLHYYFDDLMFMLISLISVVVFVYSFKHSEIFN